MLKTDGQFTIYVIQIMYPGTDDWFDFTDFDRYGLSTTALRTTGIPGLPDKEEARRGVRLIQKYNPSWKLQIKKMELSQLTSLIPNEVKPEESILESIISQRFHTWYSGTFIEFVHGKGSREEMVSQIKKLFPEICKGDK